MLLDDGKRFSVHSKVEQLFSFALLFLTHILKTDIHFLWKQQGEIAILVEMDRLRTCQHFIFQTLLDCAHWGRIPTVSRSSFMCGLSHDSCRCEHHCITSRWVVLVGLSAYLQVILAACPLWGGKASAMMTVSWGGIIPESRATEMAVSMLSPGM